MGRWQRWNMKMGVGYCGIYSVFFEKICFWPYQEEEGEITKNAEIALHGEEGANMYIVAGNI